MTKRGSVDVAFFTINGQSVLGTLTEFTEDRSAILERSDTLADAWEEHTYAGVRMAELTQEGFYDDAAGSVHDALSSGPGISKVLTYGLSGNASGRNFTGWAGAIEVNYERIFSRDDFTKARATYKNNGPVDNGNIILSERTVTASNNNIATPWDNGVSSTGGVFYWQQILSSGVAPLNAKVRHSSDALSWASICQTASSSSPRGERVVTTGTVERYLAVQWDTDLAGTTNPSYTIHAGFARKPTSNIP